MDTMIILIFFYGIQGEAAVELGALRCFPALSRSSGKLCDVSHRILQDNIMMGNLQNDCDR
ncbi:MAG: hypothetical protein II794_04890 [Oscillospiraceae bacterium]|nr:hypothetical protein [Oscillospiraceae bacterium]